MQLWKEAVQGCWEAPVEEIRLNSLWSGWKWGVLLSYLILSISFKNSKPLFPFIVLNEDHHGDLPNWPCDLGMVHMEHLARVNPEIIILKYLLYLLPFLSLFCNNYFPDYFLHNFFKETANLKWCVFKYKIKFSQWYKVSLTLFLWHFLICLVYLKGFSNFIS